MTNPTNSALHMMEGQGLSDLAIHDIADGFKSQYVHGGTTFDEFDYLGFARALIAAVAPKTALSHFADEVEASGEAEKQTLIDAMSDMLSGWRYIRASYGDLYGVGWERAQEKVERALESLTGRPA